MKAVLILVPLLAACVPSSPPEPVAAPEQVTKSQFMHEGYAWRADVWGEPGSLSDVVVMGGGGPTAPVKDFAMQGCAQAGGVFDAAAKVRYQDPGAYTFEKACQL